MDTIREFRVASETWPEADFEIRTSGNGLTFSGYAAVFDSPSDDLGGFRETIAPGAFTRTLAEKGRSKRSPIKMFLNHDWNIVLASTFGPEPTLRLTEDSRGLLVDADLPDNEWGRPVRDAVVRGDISSMSFGFNVVKDEWGENRSERRVNEVKLWEVSPVTAWPAYPATSASVRRLAQLTDTPDDDLEAAVRVLFSEDELDDTQHALLLRAINARFHSPVVSQEDADLRARLLTKWAVLDAA
jgi:HK97 family phage prohead protease